MVLAVYRMLYQFGRQGFHPHPVSSTGQALALSLRERGHSIPLWDAYQVDTGSAYSGRLPKLSFALDAHCNDVDVVVLAVLYGRCVMLQQTERHILLARCLCLFAYIRHPVLEVVPVRGRQEFQLCRTIQDTGSYSETSPLQVLGWNALHQALKRLLSG